MNMTTSQTVTFCDEDKGHSRTVAFPRSFEWAPMRQTALAAGVAATSALRKLSSCRQQTSVVSLLQECVTLQGDWIIADSAHVSLLSVGLSVFRQQSSTSCTQHGFP